MGVNERIIEQFRDKPYEWGMCFFPDYFRMRGSSFHSDILEAALCERRLAVAAPRESSKAQSLDSKVMTPDGWKVFGDIKVGDILYDGYGGTTRVIGLNEINEMDLYKVEFQCGGEVICNLDHLFEVYCPSNTKDRKLIKPLKDILVNYKSERYDNRFHTNYFEYRYYVTNIKPIEFSEKELILDPYTLGAWLGDGHSAGQRITTGDKEIIDNIPYRCSKNKAKYNWGIHGINKLLNKLNLINNKHIPKEYLFSSITQRTALLQGLIDTDGCIPSKSGYIITFCNTNYTLIKDVQHLVRSLGGKARISLHYNVCNGKRFKCYIIYIYLPEGIIPSRLDRKLKNYTTIPGGIKNRIKNITFYKRGLGRCIQVDNKYGTYVTDDFIKTHNSTILGFLYEIFCICYKRKHFIINLMNTEEKSKGNLGGIKYQVLNNELLKQVFGISIVKNTETDTVFEHPDGFQCRVLCKGSSQMGSIRGERFGPYRPDLLVGDDIEDDEMVRNVDRRRILQDDYDNAVEPAVDRELGQIILIGTILHDDSLIRKATHRDFYKDYKKLFYRALNVDKGTSLWEEKWSVEELKRMEEENPEKFAKEYQNDPVSGKRSKFSREDFRYWGIENGVVVLKNEDNSVYKSYAVKDCRAGIGCDLAWESKREHDYTVIMPGLLTPGDEILIDDYVSKKGMRPDEFEDIIFPMVEKYEDMTGSICEIGFEKAKHEKIMKWLLFKSQPKRGKYLVIKDIKWEKDKIERIVVALSPRYINHMIYHKRNMGDLEYQLMRLPDGTHDDLADAAHILSKVLKFPKKKKKEVVEDNYWDWLYKRQKQKMERKPYIFGQKGKGDRFPLKTVESFR